MANHSTILAWKIPWARGPWRATAHGVTESDTAERTHRGYQCMYNWIMSLDTLSNATWSIKYMPKYKFNKKKINPYSIFFSGFWHFGLCHSPGAWAGLGPTDGLDGVETAGQGEPPLKLVCLVCLAVNKVSSAPKDGGPILWSPGPWKSHLVSGCCGLQFKQGVGPQAGMGLEGRGKALGGRCTETGALECLLRHFPP